MATCIGYPERGNCQNEADTSTGLWCQQHDDERWRNNCDALRRRPPDPDDICRRCHREAPCPACEERGATW